MVRDGETLSGEYLHNEGGNEPGESWQAVEHQIKPLRVVEDHVHEENRLHYQLSKTMRDLRRRVASAL